MGNKYTYVMSDIHGEYDKFIKMINKINLKNYDRLYVIGDVLDKGEKPIKTLLHIINSNNITMLAGNHEHMAVLCLKYLLEEITDELFLNILSNFIEYFEEWIINGGKTTINDLLNYNKKEWRKIFEFLIKLKLYKELQIDDKKFILVHAGLGNFNKNKKLKEYNIFDLLWERINYEKKYFDDKYLVVGHTPTQFIKNNKKPGYINIKNNNIAIDCGLSLKNGRLGCLRLEDMKEFYV